MRKVLLVVFVVVFLAAAAVVAAVALEAGPFARPVSGSVVYVAISRNSDESDAREIEAIDLVAGTRELFDAGGRITAMAISVDRRTLYVAVDAGRIQLLDARTGTRFAEVDLAGAPISSLVVDPNGPRLYAVAGTSGRSAIVPIDLDTRKAGDPILLPQGAGSAVLRGDTLVVPAGTEVDFVNVTRRAVEKMSLPRGLGAARAAVGLSGTQTAIVVFEPSNGGGGTIRVYRVQDATHWQEVVLAAPFGNTIGRGGEATVFAAASTTGAVHVCVPAAAGASRRYVVTPELKSAVAGGECGPMAGGPTILLARRDPAQLLVLDPTTGKPTRTLPLAGVPARLIR